METPSIAATPPSSLAPTSSTDLVQGVFVRETERTLFSESNISAATSVDVSQAGRLLSSVAGISDAANAAEVGAAIDTETVIDQAQRFVDSVNVLSLGGQLTTDTLLDIAAETPSAAPTTTQETEAPGIDLVPISSAQDSFVLTLDSDALSAALESDAVAATSQLAAVAVPLAEAVASDLALSKTAFTELTTTQLDIAVINTVSNTQTALPGNTGSPPVVPDLGSENAQLREVLADTMLMDIVSTAASAQVSTLTVRNQAETTSEPERGAAVETAAQAQPQAAADNNPAAMSASVLANAELNAQVLNAAAVAAQVQAELGLTPGNLITTPLEQVSQLAANPAVAGAVAAFQVPADDGSRATRLAVSSGLDAINPVATVVATEAIGPNLENNNGQRHENSPDARVNQWLATRPGLI